MTPGEQIGPLTTERLAEIRKHAEYVKCWRRPDLTGLNAMQIIQANYSAGREPEAYEYYLVEIIAAYDAKAAELATFKGEVEASETMLDDRLSKYQQEADTAWGEVRELKEKNATIQGELERLRVFEPCRCANGLGLRHGGARLMTRSGHCMECGKIIDPCHSLRTTLTELREAAEKVLKDEAQSLDLWDALATACAKAKEVAG